MDEKSDLKTNAKGNEVADKYLKQLNILSSNLKAMQVQNASTHDFKAQLKLSHKMTYYKKSIKKIKNKVLVKAAVLKNYMHDYEESKFNAEKNLAKAEKHFNKIEVKRNEMLANVDQAKKEIAAYKTNKDENKKAKKLCCEHQKTISTLKKYEEKINNLQKNLKTLMDYIEEMKDESKNFQIEHVDYFSAEYQKMLDAAIANKDMGLQVELKAKIVKFEKHCLKIKTKLSQKIAHYENKKTLVSERLNALNEKYETLMKNKIANDEFVKSIATLNQKIENDKQLFLNVFKIKWEYRKAKSLKTSSEKTLLKKIAVCDDATSKINLLSNIIEQNPDEIAERESRVTIAFNRVEKVMLKDWFFIIIVALLSGGVVLATYLYIKAGVGALNEIFVVAMLRNGLDTGDYSAAMGFAAGFLIARVLEGPLVGILDVGGSILTGVGIGFPAIFLSSKSLAFIMYNPFLALVLGVVLGLIIGALIIIIRILKPKEAKGLGTDIMIGAGNATGKFLGPLVVFSAAMFNPITGIGTGIGTVIFMWIKKPIVGGAILGSMILGMIPAFIS